MIHELKTHPDPFYAVLIGTKRFEFRRDDRPFQVGDVLILREWSPGEHAWGHDLPYTGRFVRARVTYLIRGPSEFGIPAGYVCMSIEP